MMKSKKNRIEIKHLGDNAILLVWGNEICEGLNGQVIAIAQAIEQQPFIGFVECVPAYSSLAVFYDIWKIRQIYIDFPTAFEFVKNYLLNLLNHLDETPKLTTKTVRIPVKYIGEDLQTLATYCGFGVEELIRRHTAPSYRVFMMGFLPGFPYLGGLDPALAMPRLDSPRTDVPAGSVGIAGNQTGIYPVASPGGWRLIGHTDFKLFDFEQAEPVVLNVGDTVEFYAL